MKEKPVAAYPFPDFHGSRPVRRVGAINRGKGTLLPVFLLSLVSLSAATVPECTALQHHGKLDQARACYTTLLNSHDAATRAEGVWGVERYDDAKDQFEIALKEQKNNATLRVRDGRLFLERFNKAEASKLFQEALQLDDKNAAAYLGLALVASDGFSIKAVEY